MKKTVKKTLWIDASAGAAGDMLCGALLDAGGDLSLIQRASESLGLKVKLTCETVKRGAFSATHFVVQSLEPEPGHRHFSTIRERIERSGLSRAVQTQSIAVFERLAQAEARVHGVEVEAVHFHEVGAVDSIVDIVGFCVLIDALGVNEIIASPITVGTGTIQSDHGTLSLPVPAVLQLCQGRELIQSGRNKEQCTPTGAALLSTLSQEGPFPSMRPFAQGCGAGTRDPQTHANLVRVVLGETSPQAPPLQEQIVSLECQLDDMNPELLPVLQDTLLEAGALDVFITPIHMKKGRPGFGLTALCKPELTEELTLLLFHHSSTLGVRNQLQNRVILERKHQTLETPWGACRIKLGLRNGTILNRAPEFEDCKKLSQKAQVPLKTVYVWALANSLKGED
jgi:uncharacterized protein (TIGR00299 family) protein